ncbi:RNA polymerase subunit sigma-70 [Kitasatospora sp. NPDC093550]|uniref:RNA polymerase subunit sigma-70 n=1 Tax=Kitasatospora sp. NPDC093550 TaxID=3364089 RepID=UPI003822D43A
MFRAQVEELAALALKLRQTARRDAEATPDGTPWRESVETERSAGVGASDADFAALLDAHRRPLHLLCYRMVGSYDDAEDLLQETLLRAWRDRCSFEHRAAVRTWLHRIATNVCLDHLRRTGRRPQRYVPVPGLDSGPGEPPARLPWLQPYPDRRIDEMLEQVPASDESASPESAVVSRETLELVFLAAVQHLPPRQRAVLIHRDVMGRPAEETARILEMSVAAANSALQRARQTLRERLPAKRADWTPAERTREEQEVVRRYVLAAERAAPAMMAELLRADAVLTMPPNAIWFTGREAILAQVAAVFDPASPRFFGRWRFVPTAANRMPAVAGYVQRPGTSVYRAHMLDVLRVEGGRIAEITTFETHLVAACGLPLTLPSRRPMRNRPDDV